MSLLHKDRYASLIRSAWNSTIGGKGISIGGASFTIPRLANGEGTC